MSLKLLAANKLNPNNFSKDNFAYPFLASTNPDNDKLYCYYKRDEISSTVYEIALNKLKWLEILNSQDFTGLTNPNMTYLFKNDLKEAVDYIHFYKKQADTQLHQILAEESTPQEKKIKIENLFTSIKDLQNKDVKFKYLTIQNIDRNTVFHLALRPGNLDVFKDLIKNLTKEERIKLLSIQNNQGNTLLHIILLNSNFYLYNELTKDFTKEEKLYFLKIENKEKQSVFLLALLYVESHINNLYNFKELLKDFNSDEIFNLLKTNLNEDFNVIHAALLDAPFHVEIIKYLFSKVTKDHKLILLNLYSENAEQTIFELAFKKLNIPLLDEIFKGLSNEEKYELLRQKDRFGCSAIARAIYYLNTDTAFLNNLLQNLEKEQIINLLTQIHLLYSSHGYTNRKSFTPMGLMIFENWYTQQTNATLFQNYLNFISNIFQTSNPEEQRRLLTDVDSHFLCALLCQLNTSKNNLPLKNILNNFLNDLIKYLDANNLYYLLTYRHSFNLSFIGHIAHIHPELINPILRKLDDAQRRDLIEFNPSYLISETNPLNKKINKPYRDLLLGELALINS